MPVTLVSWLLIASSIAIAALLILQLRSGPARLALLSRLGLSSLAGRQDRPSNGGMLIVGAAVFLLVAGIGVATSYYARGAPKAGSSADTGSFSHSASNDEALVRLEGYTRSIGGQAPASTPAPGKMLPDVNTMIERLAARLEAAPDDSKGWRMLGWSYFNTGRYEQAAAAYAKAVGLDPSSAELKRAYEEAKAKVSEGSGGPGVDKVAKSEAKSEGKSEAKPEATPEATPAAGYSAAIRSMVDGLADRLERSPRDVEGWTRLMRSRVVLGEKEVAATALRRALEVFKDDEAATGKIRAAAIELGLKSE